MSHDQPCLENAALEVGGGGPESVGAAQHAALGSAAALSIWSADFDELYRRHLCRHSQLGINVAHFLTLVGTYVSLLGVLLWLTPYRWAPVPLVGAYLVVLAVNVPFRAWAASVVAVFVFWGAAYLIPRSPLGTPASFLTLLAYVAAIVVCHRIQLISHRWYPTAHDMSQFAGKYQKGRKLFVLLLIYELPILLNYLVFDRKSWTR